MVRALFAALIATAIVSAVLYANRQVGFLPEFDLLAQIGDFNRRLGLPATEQAAWATHAIIGTLLYGALFAILMPILPGSSTGEGITFGILAWLAMMLTFMPLSGNAVFASNLPYAVLAATLVFHILYGAVLGISYAALGDNDGDGD
jgi:uncharacterized membrane protein YagU involved in acid resistance